MIEETVIKKYKWKRVKAIALSVMCFGLIACEDSNSSDGVVKVSDLVGIWDETYSASNGLIDIWYTQRNTDGTYYIYDYQADQYDTNKNGKSKDCYLKYGPYQLIKKSGNKFRDTYEPKFVYRIRKIDDNSVKYQWIDNNTQYSFNAYRTSKVDFPLCTS